MEEEVQTADAGDVTSLAEPADQLAALAAERDQLAQERTELNDRLLRRTAEFENLRRRAERERMEFAEYAGMEIVRSLLPIIDDLERALTAARESGAADDFVKGIELIQQRMLDTLKKQGLEPIETGNAKFDPHLHHAVEMVQSDEVDDHTILGEFQRGYHFKTRLLRPSMVKVSVKP